MKPEHDLPDPTEIKAGEPPYSASHGSEPNPLAFKVSSSGDAPVREHRVASWLGRLLVSAVIWGLFIQACSVPAIYLDAGGHACTAIRMGSPTGRVALFLGWIPPYTIPWSANVLLVVGWVFLLCGRFKIAAFMGVTARR